MADLETLARRWFAAWAARDFVALAAVYDAEAEYVRPDGYLRFGIVQPTGAVFEDLAVVDIFRFRDGKIVSEHQ